MPRRDGRCDGPMRTLKDGEHVAFERFTVLRTPDAGAQLLRHDRAEVFKWCKPTMKLLQCLIGGLITKRTDEELRIENVLASGANHRSASGGVISTPCIARVPSMSSR